MSRTQRTLALALPILLELFSDGGKQILTDDCWDLNGYGLLRRITRKRTARLLGLASGVQGGGNTPPTILQKSLELSLIQ